MSQQQLPVAPAARIAAIVGVGLSMLVAGPAFGAVVGTTGTAVLDTSPYPAPSDDQIFVFDEQQGVAFVASQNLNFGTITPGTLVNSHYVQYDPASPSGTVGSGSITFNGPIIGVITSTRNLTRDLSADGAGTSLDVSVR